MRNFLSVKDVSDIDQLIGQALSYKEQPLKDGQLGQHKTIGMLFLNPSMRTRISTQLAARNLGMEVLVFNINKEGWQLEFSDGVVMDGSTAEHVKDAAAVMGQYFDLLAIRTFAGLKNKQEDYGESYIRQFVEHAGIPVVSLESATLHPLQSLADLMTIRECTGEMTRRPKVVMTWAPHIKALPQAVPNSFAQWVSAWDRCDLVIAQPEGYELDRQFTGNAEISHDQDKALEGADFVYVKNWSSYEPYGQVTCSDASWQITLDKLSHTHQARVMHCLPVRRNLVIADEVLDSDHSIVVQEAGNRVWAAQAVLSKILTTL